GLLPTLRRHAARALRRFRATLGPQARARAHQCSGLKKRRRVPMLYRVAADGVLLLHFAFVLFVVLGGLVVLRAPGFAWLHLPAVAWGAFVELPARVCPLTPLEVALRQAAGDAGYTGDFLDHYLVT